MKKTKHRPPQGDAEALRVLGEAALLSAQPARSAAAYEKAIALEPRDQQIVTVRAVYARARARPRFLPIPAFLLLVAPTPCFS